MAAADLSADALRQILTYDPVTGELRWTAEGRRRRRSDAVGTLVNGRLMIRVAGKLRLAHRLAWLLHYGKWPTFELDHINGNPTDNRIVNLRDVPHAANQRNHKARRVLVGAIPNRDGTWRAAVHQYGGSEDLGKVFSTPEEANAAWAEARKYVKNPDSKRPRLRIG